MTVAVIISIIGLMLFCSVACLVAVLSFKTTEKAFLTVDSLHARQSEQLDRALDRLMTIDWEKFMALSDRDEGGGEGFYSPEDLTETADKPGDTRWAHLRRLRFESGHTPEEIELLNEDFPDSAEG